METTRSTDNLARAETGRDEVRREIIRGGHWSHTGGKYNEDDMIDAYEVGVEKGETRMVERAQEIFRSNLGSALDESERLYFDIRSRFKLDPDKIFLKIEEVFPFEAEALYLLPLDQFASIGVFDLYRFAKVRENEVTRHGDDPGDAFSLSFRFMPLKESTSIECIMSDGFDIKYERKQGPEPTPARAA